MCELDFIDPDEADAILGGLDSPDLLTHILTDVHEILRCQHKLQTQIDGLVREFVPAARKAQSLMDKTSRLPGVGWGRHGT